MPLSTAMKSAARFAAASLLDRPQLLAVGWALTHRCNARCPFCDRHSGSPGVSTPRALQVVRELGELGCRRVHFTGGEPLLRNDLGELLGAARAAGMTTSVNTNGLLLTERPEVVEAADAFLVSLDGPASVHDAFRGRGAFAKLEEGLSALGRAQRPYLMSVTLFRENLDQIPFFLEFARRHATLLVLQPGASHVLGATRPNPEAPDAERCRAVLARLAEDRRAQSLIWNSPRGLRELSRWPEQHRLRTHAGRISARIEVDGRMFACSRSVNDPSALPAPNVFELGVEEAFRRLRRSDCSGHVCQCAHNVEKNLLFSLDPGAWWNLLRRRSGELRRMAG